MKIKLDMDIDNYVLREENKNSKIIKFYERIAEDLEQMDLSVDVSEVRSCYPNIDFPEEVSINIQITDDKELLTKLYNITDDACGMFILKNLKDPEPNRSDMLNSFNIMVYADNKDFEHFVNSEIKADLDSGMTSGFGEFYIMKYCNTLTHELTHAIEFIENSGGLTPRQVDELFDKGEFDFNVYGCITGYGTPKYYEDYKNAKSDVEIVNITEERVEEKGMLMLERTNIDFQKLYNDLDKPKFKRNKETSLGLS